MALGVLVEFSVVVFWLFCKVVQFSVCSLARYTANQVTVVRTTAVLVPWTMRTLCSKSLSPMSQKLVVCYQGCIWGGAEASTYIIMNPVMCRDPIVMT